MEFTTMINHEPENMRNFEESTCFLLFLVI
jgi:hypothetical protein